MNFPNYLILAGLWCLYFLMHSILASLALKQFIYQHTPRLMPYYRLVFNLLAILLLIPPLYFMHLHTGKSIWNWPESIHWLQTLIVILVLILFMWTLRYYDGKEFLGFRQIMNHVQDPEDQERFYISPAHQLVRHPWYTLALILLWSRDMHESYLFTTILITLYFIVGSKMEEKKLLAYHGLAYQQYMKRVSGLLPLPWKILGRREADQLMSLANSRNVTLK